MVQSILAPTPSTLRKDEIVEFDNVYHQLVESLGKDKEFRDMPHTLKWLRRVMDYNVPHGKRFRGLMVPMTYKCLEREPTDEVLKLTYILGWCIEILQASFLVADDIMDKSETRRSRACWYKVENMGGIAFNDALLLEHSVYRILSLHFQGKSYHSKIVNLFLDITHKTVMGQSLDTQTGKERNMDNYTMELYSSIVKYKTSYYTTYFPIALTLAMMEIDDEEILKKVEEIALDIGHFFQVQDDYLDCFGDENITGKVGTDIQDCKCSWLFVTAKEKCTTEQLTYLKEIYGMDDNKKVEEVKSLYKTLGLREEYSKYEEQSYANICKKVAEIGDKIPESVFYNLLAMIYKRTK